MNLAVVDFGGKIATLTESGWEIDDDLRKEILNTAYSMEPAPWDASPWLTAAKKAAAALGGKVTEFKEPPEPEPGMIH